VNGPWLNPSWIIQGPRFLFHPSFELNLKPSAIARRLRKGESWYLMRRYPVDLKGVRTESLPTRKRRSASKSLWRPLQSPCHGEWDKYVAGKIPDSCTYY
jgi:hypothetical protein